MSVVKVIKVSANSPKSWEDAAQTALVHTAKTLHSIRSMWIQHAQGDEIGVNQVAEYRVTAKLSFEIEHFSKSKK